MGMGFRAAHRCRTGYASGIFLGLPIRTGTTVDFDECGDGWAATGAASDIRGRGPVHPCQWPVLLFGTLAGGKFVLIVTAAK